MEPYRQDEHYEFDEDMYRQNAFFPYWFWWYFFPPFPPRPPFPRPRPRPPYQPRPPRPRNDEDSTY